jgi:hypothetical protein
MAQVVRVIFRVVGNPRVVPKSTLLNRSCLVGKGGSTSQKARSGPPAVPRSRSDYTSKWNE